MIARLAEVPCLLPFASRLGTDGACRLPWCPQGGIEVTEKQYRCHRVTGIPGCVFRHTLCMATFHGRWRVKLDLLFTRIRRAVREAGHMEQSTRSLRAGLRGSIVWISRLVVGDLTRRFSPELSRTRPDPRDSVPGFPAPESEIPARAAARQDAARVTPSCNPTRLIELHAGSREARSGHAHCGITVRRRTKSPAGTRDPPPR